jgi:hypothetical protein
VSDLEVCISKTTDIGSDSPHQLLQRPSSAFKDMVAASGQEEELTRAAADAASRTNIRGPDKTVVDRVKRLG